jgi:hypothetical protein
MKSAKDDTTKSKKSRRSVAVAAKKLRKTESARYASTFRKKNAAAIKPPPDTLPRDEFDELCRPFSDHFVAPFVVIDPGVADVPYTPATSYGEYSGTSCLRTVVYATRILASDDIDYDTVLVAAATVATLSNTRPMFFVSVPIYTIDPTKGDSVHSSSLFDELVMYASRAGLYVSAADRITTTIGTESLDEYNTRSPLSAERLGLVLTTLQALSADPAVAVLIPDAVQWLFSLFLP